MTKTLKLSAKFTAAAGAALALAACGSTDDAATEAEADTVEIPAEEAVADVVEQPVADPVTTAPAPQAPLATPARSEEDAAAEAGANASDVAARVKAAQEAATRQAERNMDEMETN